MNIFRSFLIALAIVCFCVSCGQADLVAGTISDFQDGTSQGWGGGTTVNIPDVGPLGAGDNALQLSNGGGGNFAMRNSGVNGVISPGVHAITVDLLRPLAQSTSEIRLVLHSDLGTRWTTTNAAFVSGNGLWDTYAFSLQEADLTRVVGAGTYNDLVNNLNRIGFRYDPGTPSSGGSPLAGTMLFDNIRAVPEPTGMAIGVVFIGALVARRRRQVNRSGGLAG